MKLHCARSNVFFSHRVGSIFTRFSTLTGATLPIGFSGECLRRPVSRNVPHSSRSVVSHLARKIRTKGRPIANGGGSADVFKDRSDDAISGSSSSSSSSSSSHIISDPFWNDPDWPRNTFATDHAATAVSLCGVPCHFIRESVKSTGYRRKIKQPRSQGVQRATIRFHGLTITGKER